MIEDTHPWPRTLASIDFYVDSPVGGSWGHALSQTAPGSATSESWDTNWAEDRGYRSYHEYYDYDCFEAEEEEDEDQNGGHLSRIIPLPDSADEQAKLIASWIVTMNVVFCVALETEPLTSNGLTQDQQEQWEEFSSSLPWGANVTIDASLKDLVRAALTDLSEEYANMRAAFADPLGPQGRALLASRDEIIESFFD